jgi:hypothetical protein
MPHTFPESAKEWQGAAETPIAMVAEPEAFVDP